MNRTNIMRSAGVAYLSLLVVMTIGCGETGNQEKGTGKTMDKWHVSEECDFGKLETGPLGANPCSPEIDDPNFLGIVINAPEEVLFDLDDPVEPSGAFADIRICGTCCFEFDFMGLEGRVQEEILLVVVNAKTQETWSGKMKTIQNPVPRPEGMDEGGGPTEGLLMESYFNPNLAETLDLPAGPAEYIVYAVLGEFKSNTVRILVKERS